MKRIVNVLALVSLLGIMATACQKETSLTPLPTIVTRTVDYRVGNGDIHRATFHGDVQWDTFLAAIFDSVDHGHRVTLSHGATTAKEVVTFSSAVKSEAMAWVDSMYNAGYDVVLWYDNETHQYNAAAQKSSGSTPEPLPQQYTYYPLGEYLQGTWVPVSCYVGNELFGLEDWLINSFYVGGYDSLPWSMTHLYFSLEPADGLGIPECYRSLRFTADSMFIEEPLPQYHGSAVSADSALRYTTLMARYTVLDSMKISCQGNRVHVSRQNDGLSFDTIDLGSSSLPNAENFYIYEWSADTIIVVNEYLRLYTWSDNFTYTYAYVRKNN